VTPDETALRRAVDAWIRALDAEDAAALAGLAAPDAVFLAPGRQPVVGREAWLAARSPRLGDVRLETTVEQVRTYGDWGHAWCEVRMTIAGTAGDPEVRVEGHTLALYRKDGRGKWLRAREAAMLAPGGA
jgi:uncharacterized protein (TIGR02246 family)